MKKLILTLVAAATISAPLLGAVIQKNVSPIIDAAFNKITWRKWNSWNPPSAFTKQHDIRNYFKTNRARYYRYLLQEECNFQAESQVCSITFSPCGNFLACGLKNGTIEIQNISMKDTISRFVGHSDEINSLDLSSDGHNLISASHDGTVKIWDVRSLIRSNSTEVELTHTFEIHAKKAFFTPVPCNDDNTLCPPEVALCTHDGCLCLFNPETGPLKSDCIEGNCVSAAIRPFTPLTDENIENFNILVVATMRDPNSNLISFEGNLKNVLDNSVELECIEKIHQGLIDSESYGQEVLFSPDGSFLALRIKSSVEDTNDKLTIFSTNPNNGCLRHLTSISVEGGSSQAFVYGGKIFAFADGQGNIKIQDLEHCKQRRTEYLAAGNIVACSPVCDLLAVSNGDEDIRLLQLQTDLSTDLSLEQKSLLILSDRFVWNDLSDCFKRISNETGTPIDELEGIWSSIQNTMSPS